MSSVLVPVSLTVITIIVNEEAVILTPFGAWRSDEFV